MKKSTKIAICLVLSNVLSICMILSTLILSSCAGLWTRIVANKISDDFSSIESYHGIMAEKGVLPDNASLVTELHYRKMWKMRAEVLEPASLKGSLSIYDGSTVTLWWPQELFGVRISGAKPPRPGDVTDVLQEDAMWAMDNYAFYCLGDEYIAGHKAKYWDVSPASPKPYLFRYKSWIDESHSIPLKLEIRDEPGKMWYSMEFTRISYNYGVPDGAFEFEFPQNAVVFEWDLADPGQSLGEIQKSMNFDVMLPKNLPGGHKVEKIIKGKYYLPMVVVLMNNKARWLSLTEMRRAGSSLQLKTGIPIEIGEESGFLHFFGTFSMVSWRKGDTALFLIGNFPYPEMISIAASAEKP